MSFMFSFPNPSDADISETLSGDNLEVKCAEATENDEATIPCGFFEGGNKEIKCDQIIQINIGDFEIKYILIKCIRDFLRDQTLSLLDDLKTDLVPGKYEGGFKIWECSLDLAQYLAEEKCINKGDSVLELGCGAGLPGIIAYLSGASVIFQDFNCEVLQIMTLSNVLLNTSEEKLSQVFQACRFLYGDWSTIRSNYYADSSAEKHDVIITSETVYEKSNHQKLLNLMKCSLKPSGVVYLATKIHYFGVGGGIVDFQLLVDQDRTFELSEVKKIMNGLERQILKMKFRN